MGWFDQTQNQNGLYCHGISIKKCVWARILLFLCLMRDSWFYVFWHDLLFHTVSLENVQMNVSSSCPHLIHHVPFSVWWFWSAWRSYFPTHHTSCSIQISFETNSAKYLQHIGAIKLWAFEYICLVFTLTPWLWPSGGILPLPHQSWQANSGRPQLLI